MPKKEINNKIKKSTQIKEKIEKIKINNYFICFGIIFLFLILAFAVKDNYVLNDKTNVSEKIEEIGKEFYKDFYNQKLKESKNIEKELSMFKNIGIKINLENLMLYKDGKYKEIIENFKVNNKTCDKVKTRVIIKPKSPYKEKDYDIKVELKCN